MVTPKLKGVTGLVDEGTAVAAAAAAAANGTAASVAGGSKVAAGTVAFAGGNERTAAALRRSTEMAISLLARRIRKTLSPEAMTRKGPS